jgi:hypothetical protein
MQSVRWFYTKSGISRQSFISDPGIKFYINLSSRSRADTCGQTDGQTDVQTDMTRVMGVFRNYAMAPKILRLKYYPRNVLYLI